MSTDNEIRINEQLHQFVKEAMTLGIDSISEGDHEPFVLLIGSDGREHLVNLEAFSGVINASLVDSGRDVIRAFAPGKAYALVWDGYLTSDGVKHDAVFAEAGRHADKTAYIFAQKYRQNARSKAAIKNGRPALVGYAKPLWAVPKTSPEFTSEGIYTILHSKALSAILRSGRSGTFTEGKKWVSAESLLRTARSAGQAVPIIFAPGENIRELTHIAELDDVKMRQGEDGKWSTTISVTNLTKIRPPRPMKTRLKVSSTGKGLLANHIRPYVVVHTPAFLTRPKTRANKKSTPKR